MEFPIDTILSGRKRISGTKYTETTKAQLRKWTHKKYTNRMELLKQEIKFLEDNYVCDYFTNTSDDESKIRGKCYTYKAYNNMAEEVIKPKAEVKKARNLKKKMMQRNRNAQRKRVLLDNY